MSQQDTFDAATMEAEYYLRMFWLVHHALMRNLSEGKR